MWIAGCVDAISFIVLKRVFTANMSGNAIHLGMEWGQGAWSAGGDRVLALGAFIAGGMITEALRQEGRRRGWRGGGLAAALAAESSLLVFFAAVAVTTLGWMPGASARGTGLALLIAIAALSMGAQNASIRRAGSVRVHSTHITGEMTHVAQVLVAALYDLAKRRKQDGAQLAQAGELLGLWALYVVGAVVATFALGVWGLGILVAPITLLFAATGWVWLHPLPDAGQP